MIHTTDAAKYEQASADYRIRLNGKQVNAFAARVSAMPFNHQWEGFQRPIEQTEMASFIHFSAYAGDLLYYLRISATESLCKQQHTKERLSSARDEGISKSI